MTRLSLLVAVDHAVGRSGPHRNVVGSLNALARSDRITVRLLTGEIDPGEPYASAANVEVVTGFAPHDLAATARNLRLLRRAGRGIDRVYVPTGLKTLLLAQALHWTRPIIVGPNMTPVPNRRHDAPGWFDLRVLGDRWIEASEARASHVRRVAGDPGVVACPHGIDTTRFSPARRRPDFWPGVGVDPGAFVFLHVGRDDIPLKGVPQLMDAFARAHGARPDCRLVLVGTFAGRYDHPGVIHLGPRYGDHLADLYANADAAVLPSSWENFPFVVLEAMASGVAVIASDVGGVPDLLGDDRHGALVHLADDGRHRPDAATTLAAAMLELLADPDRVRRQGAAARARAVELFSEDALLQRLEPILLDPPPHRSLLRRGGPR